LGCTKVGQVEEDVRIAQEFKHLNAQEMAQLRDKAAGISGPGLEDWKRGSAVARFYSDGGQHNFVA